jgi:hypothetical protein
MTVCVWVEIQIQRTSYQIEARSVTPKSAGSVTWYYLAGFMASFLDGRLEHTTLLPEQQQALQ